MPISKRMQRQLESGLRRIGTRALAQQRRKAAPKVDRRYKVDSTQWAEGGQWVRVKSSNVQGIKYNLERKQLFVEFKGGSIYQYSDVPVDVAQSMFTAGSMGQFVWRQLRDKYPYSRIH